MLFLRVSLTSGLLTALSFLAQGAFAQEFVPNETADRFIGMWRLVSWVDSQGQQIPNRGPSPTGFIVYDASGNMSVQIMPDRSRPQYVGAPTPDEAKAILTGYVAYFGRWTIDEGAQTVTHYRTGSINPDFDAPFVRRYEFGPGGRVTLIPGGGSRLTWERVE